MVDECTGPKVANWLKGKGHDVFSVYNEARGMDDESLLRKANAENYILITNDKDFGEIIFRLKKPHKGIILLRLESQKAEIKITVLEKLIKSHSDRLQGTFVVVTEKNVRIIEQ
jgi:predicted nuclease of predicted toxin-antitoxin system